MNFIDLISYFLKSEYFQENIIFVSDIGASAEQVNSVEAKLGRRLSSAHRAILEKWDGIGFDAMRFYGTRERNNYFEIASSQIEGFSSYGDMVIFGSTSAGFVYGEDKDGKIWEFDTKMGDVEFLANDMKYFVENHLFGENAAEFVHKDYAEKLEAAGIYPPSNSVKFD